MKIVAGVAILAVDINIEGRERFKALRVIEAALQEAIKNPRSIFNKLRS
jgi:fructose-specific phosphotransferase system component IIB